jgi:hypothetical protein
MSYDFDGLSDHSAPAVPSFIPEPHDLEQIVLLLELGAIQLTPEPDTAFTFEELLAEAREVGGEDFRLEEADVRIVLPLMKSLKKLPGGRYSLK